MASDATAAAKGPLIVPRERIEALRPCDIVLFEQSKYRVGDALVFPDGWTPELLAEFAENRPRNLFWLAAHRLIPVTMAQAKRAVSDALGRPPLAGKTPAEVAALTGIPLLGKAL